MKQELLNPKKKIEAKVDPNLTNEQLDIIIVQNYNDMTLD